MEKDAKDSDQTCDKCQRHALMIHRPRELLHPVLSPWPFMKWGMDIVGPLPWAHCKAQYILFMAVYFCKLVEAHSFEKVRENEVIDFIWDHIICRFGISTEITCDNGRQFIGNKFNKFFEDHKIKKILSNPYHPSANSQADSTKEIILQNMRKRLADSK
ncbi:uncharacterized protein LOC142169627 [Nicotiana tabacum]|uniref:Uncharacterized protein LOC142169627 n=1 Tax=Nicotiana tabacum TaxID=4097 RepID=A0AC58SRL9_TOBAC